MLKKILATTFAIALGVSAQAAWSADGFTVEKKKNRTLGDVTDIIITSRLDAVSVSDIAVNRGNCRLINAYGSPVDKPFKPFPMKFGGTVQVGAAGFCNPVEVQITTDKGVFTSSWQQ